MENQPRGAILQRDGATYAIVPRTPAGIVSPEDLENIIKVVRRYSIPIIKMTSGQRMVLVGIKEEDVEKIWNELGMTVGQATAPCVHYVQACPGTETCRYGKQDSLGLGLKIEEIYQDLNISVSQAAPAPAARVTSGTSGFSGRQKAGGSSSAATPAPAPGSGISPQKTSQRMRRSTWSAGSWSTTAATQNGENGLHGSSNGSGLMPSERTSWP